MKYPIVLAVGLFAIFPCTRTNNPPASPGTPPTPPVATDSLLKSYTIYSPGARIRQVEVFTFDKNNQLATLHSYTYVSTLSWSPVIDSTLIVFAVTGTATPPPSYDILYFLSFSPPGGLVEHHQLYYDNQNRVIRDSIASGNNRTNNTSVHFAYDSIKELEADFRTVGVNG